MCGGGTMGQCLHELKNFSTLMAFIAGLNNAAITRLKWTRAEMPSRLTKVRTGQACAAPVAVLPDAHAERGGLARGARRRCGVCSVWTSWRPS